MTEERIRSASLVESTDRSVSRQTLDAVPMIKRTTLIVRDVERSMIFYRDGLGLSIWYDDTIELSGVGLAAGQRGDKTRLIIMRARDPLIGMVGLLQFTEPTLAAPKRREHLGIGDIVFVMQGPDIVGVHERVPRLGGRIHAAPHRFEVRGADGSQLAMTSLSFWDPDDYFIEYNCRD
jgi:catechol 2,3-dioxygenase-like lactoylglutathione lyase family enzyme